MDKCRVWAGKDKVRRGERGKEGKKGGVHLLLQCQANKNYSLGRKVDVNFSDLSDMFKMTLLAIATISRNRRFSFM